MHSTKPTFPHWFLSTSNALQCMAACNHVFCKGHSKGDLHCTWNRKYIERFKIFFLLLLSTLLPIEVRSSNWLERVLQLTWKQLAGEPDQLYAMPYIRTRSLVLMIMVSCILLKFSWAPYLLRTRLHICGSSTSALCYIFVVGSTPLLFQLALIDWTLVVKWLKTDGNSVAGDGVA